MSDFFAFKRLLPPAYLVQWEVMFSVCPPSGRGYPVITGFPRSGWYPQPGWGTPQSGQVRVPPSQVGVPPARDGYPQRAQGFLVGATHPWLGVSPRDRICLDRLCHGRYAFPRTVSRRRTFMVTFFQQYAPWSGWREIVAVFDFHPMETRFLVIRVNSKASGELGADVESWIRLQYKDRTIL